ncbi:MAG TPA: Calx-beta domain-containing protein [Verrucomicrobiae bacterium]
MRNALLLITVVSATCLNVSAQIKAQDYDTPSYVQFSLPRYEVSQTETNAVVTIVRSGDSRKTASVDYTTVEGTASEGVDFQACGGTIVFAAGQCFRTITIPVTRSSDLVTKTFQVELTEPGFDTIITTPTADVQIQPQPPALNIAAKKGALVISWPDSETAFVLEAQVDGQWSAVGVAPTLGDGTWSVTFTPTIPVALFRLRHE